MSDPFADFSLERIEWTDSQLSYASWTHLEDIDPARPFEHQMLTVGWVIRENEGAILIASSLGNTDGCGTPQVCHAMTIPKRCITDRRKLKG